MMSSVQLQVFRIGYLIRTSGFFVPEKEFDYWIGRYLFETNGLSNRDAGFIDGKMVFY